MFTPVTKILLLTNTVVFVILNILVPNPDPLFQLLGLHPADFRIWQPITSLFLHAGFLHIAFNMVALWSIGTPIERDIGSRRFLILYSLSGLGGALAVLIFPGNPDAITIGASGAVLGLLGALAVLYPNTMLIVLFFPMRARTAALLFLGFSLLLSFTGSLDRISHAGHIGGLLVGLLYSRLFLARSFRRGSDQAEYNRQEVMRAVLRDMGGKMVYRGGQFIGSENSEKEERASRKYDIGIERPKKLYYDPESGTFFYR